MNSSDRTTGYRERVYSLYVTGREAPFPSSHDRTNYYKWAKAAEGRLRGWLPPNRNAAVLDLGCGHGNFLFMLEQLGYRNLAGVDLSEQQIDCARNVCEYAAIVRGDVTGFLRSTDQTFDLISCLNIVEHLSRDEALELLELVHTRLNTGGRVLIETPNAASPWFGVVAYGDLTHEWFYTPRSLADTLRLLGFSDFEARSSMACVPTQLRLCVRCLAWKVISAGLSLVNLIETGSAGDGISTRVFVATAVKR